MKYCTSIYIEVNPGATLEKVFSKVDLGSNQQYLSDVLVQIVLWGPSLLLPVQVILYLHVTANWQVVLLGCQLRFGPVKRHE